MSSLLVLSHISDHLLWGASHLFIAWAPETLPLVFGRAPGCLALSGKVNREAGIGCGGSVSSGV